MPTVWPGEPWPQRPYPGTVRREPLEVASIEMVEVEAVDSGHEVMAATPVAGAAVSLDGEEYFSSLSLSSAGGSSGSGRSPTSADPDTIIEVGEDEGTLVVTPAVELRRSRRNLGLAAQFSGLSGKARK